MFFLGLVWLLFGLLAVYPWPLIEFHKRAQPDIELPPGGLIISRIIGLWAFINAAWFFGAPLDRIPFLEYLLIRL